MPRRSSPWVAGLLLVLEGCSPVVRAGSSPLGKDGSVRETVEQDWLQVELEGWPGEGTYRARVRRFPAGGLEIVFFHPLAGRVLQLEGFAEGWRLRDVRSGKECRLRVSACFAPGLGSAEEWLFLDAVGRLLAGQSPCGSPAGSRTSGGTRWVRSAADPSGRTWVPLGGVLVGSARIGPGGSEGDLRAPEAGGGRVRWKRLGDTRQLGGVPRPDPWDSELPECSGAALP